MGHPTDRHSRPEWWNGISLGNVITIAGGCIVAAVTWGAYAQQQEEQDRRIEKTEHATAELAKKAESMAVKQAYILANIELLVRAEGLTPIVQKERSDQ